ncbi:hypothetical protein OBBRIDRAFT_141607 [Obba rivulosa]|uniref:DNA2/NAM7 helicase helicase domain-containing protein n=1 Tax=Obba rivulosa TaxID=1052685 RepID=A0A8E2DRJ1_9APHY|nr:hypothetical protein OBBRIDRAFT_141607 [Obba rivulosa]
MVKETTTLQQTIFKKAHEPIQVTLLDEVDLNVSVLSDFLQTAVQNDVGLATVHGPKGVLRALAFSSPSHALYVRFCKPGGKKVGRRAQAGVTGSPKTPRIILTEQLLCNPSYRKLAFDMHHVAAALYFDHGLYIKNAIDLQSAQREQRFRSTLRTLSDVLGGDTVLNTSQVAYNFLGHGLNSDLAHNACLRAWACCRVRSSTHWNLNLMGARQIDTEVMQKKHLIVICKFVRDAQRLEALKPTIVKNNVKAEFSCKDGVLQLECTHFSSRLRRSKTQKIVVTAGSKQGSQITAKGRTVQVKGKRASVSLDKPISSKYTDIRSVQTFGRDDPSPADAERTRVLLSIFQSTTNVLHQPLAVRIFSLIDPPLSPRSKQVPRACQSSPPEIDFTARPLNASQQRAVRRVLSDDIAHRVCLIHGPPGTGKTTVIAACVSSILARSNVKEGVWLVAQSNVAVKNIAEKLAEFGLEDFKLLVSKDFHFEWHEHLYEKIKPKVIRTDMFGAGGRVGTERRLLGSRVMLCTLSMFSYPRFLDGEFSRIVPVNTVLVDEASQIELGSYLPLLHNFGDMIQKLAFIGDDKQRECFPC